MSTIDSIIRKASILPEQSQKELLAMAKGMEAALKVTQEETAIADA